MQATGNGLIQAVEWKPDMPVSSGDFKSIRLIHCVEDGSLTAKFLDGDKSRDFLAGDDFVLPMVDVTVSSGKFDLN